MMIWSIRSEGCAPQHIGNFDGIGSLKKLISAGNSAGHRMKIAIVAAKGNDARVYTFDTMADYTRFIKHNQNLIITDRAIGF